MSTPESSRPRESDRKEFLFPLEGFEVIKALASIENGPVEAFNQEVKEIKEKNLALATFVASQFEEYEDEVERRNFYEGVVWTHRILRYNAGKSMTLPELSAETIEGVKELAVAERPNEPFNRVCVENMQGIMEGDQHLRKAIGNLSRFSTNRPDFYFGAYLVAGSFKRHDDLKKLQASLG